MSDETTTAPVTANLATGAVTADVSDPIGKPSRRTVSVVWLSIVGANVFVMVVAALSLAVALFFPDRASLVKPEALLILFTTPSAFLAGLIARDPGQHN